MEEDDEVEGTENYLTTLGTPGDDVGTEVGTTRPRQYDAGVMEKILMKIADGATLREISREAGMPTKSTVQRWIMKVPDLTAAWKAARELSAASLEDESLDMARVLKRQSDFTGTKVRAFEVAMNQFRWSASHRDPATYGTTTTANVVVPIQINTSLDLGDGKGTTSVKMLGASTTYEVAAKYGEAYNAKNETLEGTDYTVEVGEGARNVTVEPVGGEGDELPTFAPIAPAILQTRRRKPSLRPKKGHKTEAATKRAITRRLNKEKKNG